MQESRLDYYNFVNIKREYKGICEENERENI